MKKRKVSTKHRLNQWLFPTRSRIKLHQSPSSLSSTGKANGSVHSVPLNDQVARLNQRAVDVRLGVEKSITSLQTQRLEHLTQLTEKTRDLERAAAALEYSSSKHLQEELNKTRQISYLFKIALTVCLTFGSFLFGYLIIQWWYQSRRISS